ncbi:ABC transporter permease [Candidatus Latescibacterota bacterium]
MDYIFEGLKNAVVMIVSFDSDLFAIVYVSLKVSIISTLLATLTGVPFGFFMALKQFRGRGIIILILHTLLALPTVLIGLLVYSFISRRGPFGNFGLLYTQWAMVIGQVILVFPIISSLSLSAIQSVDKKVERTARTLGANRMQTAAFIFLEGKFALFSAIITGFGRVFGEVGISMILGGNIRGLTRNITTAIAFETGKGEFALGIALGLVLLTVAFAVNVLLYSIRKKRN